MGQEQSRQQGRGKGSGGKGSKGRGRAAEEWDQEYDDDDRTYRVGRPPSGTDNRPTVHHGQTMHGTVHCDRGNPLVFKKQNYKILCGPFQDRIGIVDHCRGPIRNGEYQIQMTGVHKGERWEEFIDQHRTIVKTKKMEAFPTRLGVP